jgi:hypothetical protein
MSENDIPVARPAPHFDALMRDYSDAVFLDPGSRA